MAETGNENELMKDQRASLSDNQHRSVWMTVVPQTPTPEERT